MYSLIARTRSGTQRNTPRRKRGNPGHVAPEIPVTFDRNSRSRSSGTAGHVRSESVVTLPRNSHSTLPQVYPTPSGGVAPCRDRREPAERHDEGRLFDHASILTSHPDRP